MKCYCGSGKDFECCCGPYLDSAVVVETAEQLMRSRYSAFKLKNERYLRASWVSGQCPENLSFDEQVNWIKLDILSTEKGLRADQEGVVEFKAWFILQDELHCIHEKSDFERLQGRWLYRSGSLYEVPVESLSMKQSCPCGSGKKYKHCCKKAES